MPLDEVLERQKLACFRPNNTFFLFWMQALCVTKTISERCCYYPNGFSINQEGSNFTSTSNALLVKSCDLSASFCRNKEKMSHCWMNSVDSPLSLLVRVQLVIVKEEKGYPKLVVFWPLLVWRGGYGVCARSTTWFSFGYSLDSSWLHHRIHIGDITLLSSTFIHIFFFAIGGAGHLL